MILVYANHPNLLVKIGDELCIQGENYIVQAIDLPCLEFKNGTIHLKMDIKLDGADYIDEYDPGSVGTMWIDRQYH